MRIISVFVVALFVLAGCDNGKQAELENQNKDLKAQLASKDQYIQDVTSTISEIHNQLEGAWSMERKVLRESSRGEMGQTLTPADLKQKILSRISDISHTLAANHKKVTDLERRLKESTTQYSGLSAMVDDLKKTIEEREKSIADLNARVSSLQSEVLAKAAMIAQRDTTISNQSRLLDDQVRTMNTVFYVIGKRSDLKDKGVITREGGFLWGLIGATTVLSSDYDGGYFAALDKTKYSEIEVPGKIDEIVPERAQGSYAAQETGDGHTILKIIKPDNFWRENHLVIISD